MKKEESNMIKKQQKWIALLVALTFMWLLQVSTMPVAAAGTAEQVGSANADQGPDFVEAVGHKVAPAPKKSILPIILIGVGVVAVAAVLFLVVLKTKYDIVGSWTLIFTGPSYEIHIVTFTGTKDSGSFRFDATSIFNGTYSVDGKNVAMVATNKPSIIISGQFTGKDTMTGTWVDGAADYTWTAMRNAATPTVNRTPTTQSKLFPK
jgi:hypothetical protein